MRTSLREDLFGAACVAAAFIIIGTARDRNDVREAADRWSAKTATWKDHAIKWAVEQYGSREYFASDFHCALPIEGERLVMEAASPEDPGKGYRCVYYVMQQRPDRVPVATMTWSRSEDLVAVVPVERSER
jgi:hypothetical protein